MSSEALPLIFEPFEDVTPEGAAAVATLVPGSTQPPAAMATRGMPLSEVDLDQLVTVETDSDSPSHAPSLLMPDWTSPWQTSGAELLEPISSSVLSVSQQQAGTEPQDGSERGERGDVIRINKSVFRASMMMLCDIKTSDICNYLPAALHYFAPFLNSTYISNIFLSYHSQGQSCKSHCFHKLHEKTLLKSCFNGWMVPKQIMMAQ